MLLIILLTLLSPNIVSLDFKTDFFKSEFCFSDDIFVSAGDWGVVLTNLLKSCKVWLLLFFWSEPAYLSSEDTLIYKLLHLASLFISGSVNTVCANYTFFGAREILLESVFSLKEGKIDWADFLSPVCKSNSLWI